MTATATRESGRSGVPGTFAQARWLAGKEIRRSWLSYPASGLFALFFGLVATPSVREVSARGANGARDLGAVFFADYLLVIAGCVLVVNAISQDYLRVWSSDVFSRRAAFLRSLPLSTATLVASRAMRMLFAVPFTAPAFFAPLFLFTDLRGLGFSYVWFCGIWLGWGLLYAGVTLLCELGLSGKVYCWLSLAVVALLAGGLLLIESISGGGLLRYTANLAAGHGPLAALVSVAVGSAGFALLAKLTRRVDRRDLSA